MEKVTSSGDLISSNTSDAEQLELYGLFKRATVGSEPSTARPGWTQIRARKKYDSWVSYKDISADQAKEKYVALADKLFDRFSD